MRGISCSKIERLNNIKMSASLTGYTDRMQSQISISHLVDVEKLILKFILKFCRLQKKKIILKEMIEAGVLTLPGFYIFHKVTFTKTAVMYKNNK